MVDAVKQIHIKFTIRNDHYLPLMKTIWFRRTKSTFSGLFNGTVDESSSTIVSLSTPTFDASEYFDGLSFSWRFVLLPHPHDLSSLDAEQDLSPPTELPSFDVNGHDSSLEATTAPIRSPKTTICVTTFRKVFILTGKKKRNDLMQNYIHFSKANMFGGSGCFIVS